MAEMKLFQYNSSAFKAYLKEHTHEAAEVKFLQSIAEEGMNALDIGGHIGITAITIAKKIGKDGLVYSFEPVPEYLDILKKNIAHNKIKNIKVFNKAVTNRVETSDFYQDGGGSSIVPKEGIEKFSVKTTAIDVFLDEEKIDKIDLINMDSEGAELLVLKGAEKTLRRNKVKIFCEIHHGFLSHFNQSAKDIVDYLQKLNYEVKNVSLNDLSMDENFDKPEYIYAHN
ncbi:MAG: hypothetical protein COS84_00795 [Armatimonadetes bacterium CG07_land_8_20_14_0_80_40_9]|nr:MAG: hypothetical protein COS84_00795 [Armatimonadetes bacterium CG07_land_8_20_14_0_80_40_9]